MKVGWMFLITLLLFMSKLLAQKKDIDLAAIKDWDRLGNYNISNDGKYVWYEVISESKGTNLVVCDASGAFKRQFSKAYNVMFSEDSRYIYFYAQEELHQLELKTGIDEIIAGANNFILPSEGNGRWLTYKRGETLWLRDLTTRDSTEFQNAKNCLFNKQGNSLLVQTDSSILIIQLPDRKKRVIFKGKGINKVVFDNSGKQLAIYRAHNKQTDIFSYQLEGNKLELLVSDTSSGMPPGFKICGNDIMFSEDGKVLFFKITQTAAQITNDVNTITKDVYIWNYKDVFLPSEQSNSPSKRNFAAVVSKQSKKVVQLEDENTLLEKTGNNFAILKTNGNYIEAYWRNSQQPRYKIVSYVDGQSLTTVQFPARAAIVELSPAEKYVTFVDTRNSSYNCVEISSGRTYELSKGFDVFPVNKRDTFQIPFRILQWTYHDKAIIIGDQNDIWRVDPQNKNRSICLTAGLGKQEQLVFSTIPNLTIKPLVSNDSLLLAVFDKKTKFNGFAKVKLSNHNQPKVRLSAPCIYYLQNILTERIISPPKKARNAEAYLIQHQSVAEDPNIFITSNFTNLQQISDINTHLRYKWHSSQLQRWKGDDGSVLEGILYYPDDLDTTKKYPIIFNYYEERSHELFKYNDPSYLGVSLNIAWYLNKGYLVFIPDILPAKGATGENALNSVVSAANFLTNKYAWIDKSRMGLQGHSHGGYITNYIVAHSDLFAAAQSGSGYSDFVRGFGELGFGGGSLQFIQEIGQNNLGTTPWVSPSTYIKNSPIFFVDKVNTPLLIMHNKDDGAVQFGQSVELFTALRRLEKRVWLLQYEGEGHSIWNFDRAYDFLIRQQQFFDHYLKRSGAPVWMTKGLPLKFKGLRSGLEIDASTSTP